MYVAASAKTACRTAGLVAHIAVTSFRKLFEGYNMVRPLHQAVTSGNTKVSRVSLSEAHSTHKTSTMIRLAHSCGTLFRSQEVAMACGGEHRPLNENLTYDSILLALGLSYDSFDVLEGRPLKSPWFFRANLTSPFTSFTFTPMAVSFQWLTFGW